MDDLFRRFLKSEAPNPTQKSLERACENADRVLVCAEGFNFEPVLGTHFLLDERDPASLGELRLALRINEAGRFGHCMCVGDLGIAFFQGEKSCLTIGLHHGQTIRCELWKWDAPLRDGEALLNWLAARGVSHPKNRRDADLQRAQESRDQWQRWLDAAPGELAAHPKLLAGEMAVFDWNTLRPLIEVAWPEPAERARSLFAWFANGSGAWSGFPSYELVPEHFLEELDEPLLFQALQSDSLAPHVKLGAARYFAHQTRNKNRSKNLSDELKSRLLRAAFERASPQHAEDIQRRAERAFGKRNSTA